MITKMSGRPRLGWAVGAVVGLVVAGGVGVTVQQAQEVREVRDIARRQAAFDRVGSDVPAPVDAVRQLLEQEGPVVVDPELDERVSAEDLDRAEALLASAQVPSHLAYLKSPKIDSGYTKSGATAQWADAVGERGHYVVLYDDGTADIEAIGLEEEYFGAIEVKGQPGPALVRIAEDVASWDAEERVVRPPSTQDDWGGISGGVVGVVFAGGLLVFPAFVGLRHFLIKRRKDT